MQDSESNAAKPQMYEVTVTNITPGQPITPPLLVTHAKDVRLFTVGEEAEWLQQLAENGNASLLIEKLEGKSGVMDIVKGSVGHLVQQMIQEIQICNILEASTQFRAVRK